MLIAGTTVVVSMLGLFGGVLLLVALVALALAFGRSRTGLAAVAVLAVAFVSPLCALSAALFSARVVHHVLLVAVGATPRELADSPADGHRILNWTQLYRLETIPEHLVVVGSGVTGAERDPNERALITSATTVKK